MALGSQVVVVVRAMAHGTTEDQQEKTWPCQPATREVELRKMQPWLTAGLDFLKLHYHTPNLVILVLLRAF